MKEIVMVSLPSGGRADKDLGWKVEGYAADY